MHERSNTGEDLLLTTFMLGEAVFGIDAQLVQEIAKPGDITVIHHAPDFVRGIRNLRGRIVTVVDMAVLLHLEEGVVDGPENRILIMEWGNEPVGFLVDSVDEAITTRLQDLAPPPANLYGLQRQDLIGVYHGEGKLVGVINLDNLLAMGEDIGKAGAATGTSS